MSRRERRNTPLSTLAAALLLALAALTGCDGCDAGGSGEETTSSSATSTEPAPELPPFSELAGVDATELDDGSPEQRLYWSQVNDLTSPCGEPVSVAECITSDEVDCSQCRGAASYIVRLAAAGATRAQIRELYRTRYGEDTAVEVNIDDAQIRGAVMAPITIVEFSDFECPFCGRAHPLISRVLEQYEGRVRLAFMHYPLSMHQHAANAALAAEAAGAQGKFWEMHDILFENQAALTNEDIFRYAAEIGLDMDRFRADLESEELRGRIERTRAEGQRIEVNSTPTIIVNGRHFDGHPETLAEYIGEMLND